jgi:hypothetical protein
MAANEMLTPQGISAQRPEIARDKSYQNVGIYQLRPNIKTSALPCPSSV